MADDATLLSGWRRDNPEGLGGYEPLAVAPGLPFMGPRGRAYEPLAVAPGLPFMRAGGGSPSIAPSAAPSPMAPQPEPAPMGPEDTAPRLGGSRRVRVDPRQLQEWAQYLRDNQADAQSEGYQTVARAFQRAYGQMQDDAAREALYTGLGGAAKATGQGLGAGALEGLDWLTQALGGRLVRTVQSYATGQPMKPSAGEILADRLAVPGPEDVPESVRGW